MVLKYFLAFLNIVCYIFIIMLFFIFISTPLLWVVCETKYNDSQYYVFWWCKINYDWEYIPEDLYKKTFEQNLIIK